MLRSAEPTPERIPGSQLVCVPPDRVADVWPHICGLIYAAAVKCGDLSSYQPVESSVLAGHALLWLVTDDGGLKIHAAVVTKLQRSDRRKVCVIAACGGSDMRRWLDLIGPIEEFARAEGCSTMRIVGRQGWARVLPAYRLKNVVLEKEI